MDLRPRRLPAVLLFSFALAGALPVVRSLLVADLNWCYPYNTADSYDWINNGLYWAGASVAPALRAAGGPRRPGAGCDVGVRGRVPVCMVRLARRSTTAPYG